jgi:hypothetical protein
VDKLLLVEFAVTRTLSPSSSFIMRMRASAYIIMSRATRVASSYTGT